MLKILPTFFAAVFLAVGVSAQEIDLFILAGQYNAQGWKGNA